MNSDYIEKGRFGRGCHVRVSTGLELPFSATVVDLAHRLSGGEAVYRLAASDNGGVRFARESRMIEED
jgi:hypothetical protein